jgi:hypothetical protein
LLSASDAPASVYRSLVGEGTFRGWPWAEQNAAGLSNVKNKKGTFSRPGLCFCGRFGLEKSRNPLTMRVPTRAQLGTEAIAFVDVLSASHAGGLLRRHRPGGMRENNLAENSRLVIRRRERKQQKFRSLG